MSNFESGFSSDDPKSWEAVPDENAAVNSALASEALIAAMQKDDPILIRNADGTIEERGENNG